MSHRQDPPRILVSFLGRPRRDQGGQYETVEYRFDDGHRSTTSFFGAAVAEWMLRSAATAPQRWLIIGTPTSAWDQLVDVVLHLAPQEEHRVESWMVQVGDELQAGRIDPARLREFEAAVRPAIGIDLRLEAVESEGDAIFECLLENLPQDGRVVLDITHGFRTMPTHALVSLGALAWLKGIRIDDIFYGERPESNAPHRQASAPREAGPAIAFAKSLAGSAELARATPGLARLRLDDDLGAVADIFEGDGVIAEKLRSTERLKATMQYDRCAPPRGQALGALRARQSQGSIAQSIDAAVIGALERLSTETTAIALRHRAEAALERSDFLRAVALAYESLILRAVELRDLPEKHKATAGNDRYFFVSQDAREECLRQAREADAPRWPDGAGEVAFKRLGHIRNAIMHAGTQLGGHRRPAELSDADKLRGILRWAFAFCDYLR